MNMVTDEEMDHVIKINCLNAKIEAYQDACGVVVANADVSTMLAAFKRRLDALKSQLTGAT